MVSVHDFAGAPAPAADLDEALSLQRAMAGLPEDQRTAILLVLVEGFSYAEAAAVLDIPIGTLTSRLGRARAALQGVLAVPSPANP